MSFFITTSRNPSKKTKEFARDLSLSFPNSHFKARSSIESLADEARYQGKKLILVIQEEKKEPGRLQIINVNESNFSFGDVFSIKLEKLRKNLSSFKKASECLSFKGAKLKALFKELEIYTGEGDCEFICKESKGVVSFFAGKQEIGPRFRFKKIV